MEDGIQTNLFEIPSRKLTLKKREPSQVDDNPSFISHKYAVCLVNIKVLGVKTFSYIIPPEMQDKINKLREHRELEIIQFEDYIGTKK